MNTRSTVISFIFYLIVCMIFLNGCTNEDMEIQPENQETIEPFDVPVNIASYFSSEQINTFYSKLESEGTILPPAYTYVPVMIEVKQEIDYLFPDSANQLIRFEGPGTWDKKAIRYFEEIDITNSVTAPQPIATEGYGNILVQRQLNRQDYPPSREDLLEFDSYNRNRLSGNILSSPFDSTVRFESEIKFTGGYGIYDGSYGYAIKTEFLDVDHPETGRAAILGYVFIKNQETNYPTE